MKKVFRLRHAIALIAIACAGSSFCNLGAVEAAEIKRSTLNNGARLLVSEQNALPMVLVRITIDAGSRRDPPGKEGLASLSADLLTEGTESYTAARLSEEVDFIGASISSYAGVDYAIVSLSVLRRKLAKGIDLLEEVLLKPTFPTQEIARQREATLAAIQASEDHPGQVANRAFTESLFRNEPYGHLTEGKPAALRSLTRTDIRSFYREHYRANGAFITVAGDVEEKSIRKILNRKLAGWVTSNSPPFHYESHKSKPENIFIEKPIGQSSVILGHRGISRDNEDYFAIQVMNFILGGGGFGSRLLDRIRTKSGLAYSVYSSFTAPKAPGSFRITLQTKNESVGDAVEQACEEIIRIRKSLVEEVELSGAKLYLTGNFPMQLDSNRELVGFMSHLEFFDLGLDYEKRYISGIQSVSRKDIQRVARKYLRPDELRLVVVGKPDSQIDPRERVCPATTSSSSEGR